MISVIITFQVKSDEIDNVKRIIRTFITKVSENEPETLFYKSFQNKDDTASFIHIMTFKNSEAQEIHRSSEHCKKFVESLYPLCSVLPNAINYEEIR